MPRIKKPRKKGVTYKLVPRSYGDADGEDQGPLWVSEAEFFRRHQSAVPAEDEDGAQLQFNMYAVAANAEFNDERRRRRAEEGEDEACGVYDNGEADAEGGYEGEYCDEEGEYYDEYDEDGEWVDGDWKDEEKPEAPHLPAAMQKAELPPASAADTALVSSCPPAAAACPRDEDGHECEVCSEANEEQEEEKLFDDEVEAEVTDDFLRQLVFGSGDGGEGGEGDEDSDDWDGLDEEDSEMWRLLTDDEKAAIKASRRRGTARRRRVVDPAVGEGGGLSRTHAADGTEYPTHDTTQRALDRQFTEMMREFDADARLNDAYTDDPRTHGPLPMDKYLTALEEFVASRAGIDVETAEPHKNKGLIQQLKYLSHHAGAFDSDARGVYMTTILPEKQQRFVEEFQKGTEEVRRAARMRLATRNTGATAAATAAAVAVPSDQAAVPAPPPEGDGTTGEEEEELIVMEVKSKADRLDCETAISAHSTYYNQPNVIQVPRRSAQTRRVKKAPVSRSGGELTGAEAGNNASHRNGSADITATTVVRGGMISAGAAPSSSGSCNTAISTISSSAKKGSKTVQVREPTCDADREDDTTPERVHRGVDAVLTVRRKDETKEEKMMRRQAVKAAQRERRQAKSALKNTYKEVESEELRRSATSQAARRTVHFM
ncbi:conserved hypothetical protein [Leishmania mexicana MHOM/GT/2001/U1103]|uniref:Uncharacterized protein n=1 Tax=Leishmania mexicana (strain MHOM/GT/2001/U1103) TaxID=929439 RepID=E9ALT4_LEIMU|nr:conserved hypothetical protein [Leishmania mexicana MHOM/GT/2001/U1103]CBZ23889.1 conserved hypothetical protein [Leishmania mexicana MHOM/GT/2001/U1103]